MISEKLKHRILLKTGLTNITSNDCKKIVESINRSLNREISITTIKRVFGFAKSNHRRSKYTLAILNDYVNDTKEVLPSRLAGNQEISSFIIKNHDRLSELDDKDGLHPQRLVIEALELLLKHDHEYLPLITMGKCVGMVYVKDLIYFLTCDERKCGTLFHKLNFTLECAIYTLMNKRIQH